MAEPSRWARKHRRAWDATLATLREAGWQVEMTCLAAPVQLERNVSPEAVRRYKLTSLGAVNEAAALVQRVLPELTLAECGEFVATLASLAGSLWQIANPVPALAELYASDPALAQVCVDLMPRLRRTAEILLAGLIPSRNPGSGIARPAG